MTRQAHKIAWLLPRLIEGSGGHRTMFQAIDALARHGHACAAYVEPDYPAAAGDDRAARDRVTRLFGPTAAEVRAGFDLREDYDLIFATAWYTARIARDAAKAARKAYFVQDFEAWFNPMGDGYLMAENSYRLGLTPITIGRWLTHKLQTEFGCASSYFDFCADLGIYRPDPSIPKEKAVCFTCQPDKPRRCTLIGLEALGILKRYLPDVKIYLYGSVEPVDAWFSTERLGLISVQQCSTLYNRCQAGLCISSSNPSRIPFEMMAAGLPVVDVYRENNLCDMPDGGVLLAEASPESIAKALAMIITDPQRQARMATFGPQFMAERDLRHGHEQFVAAVDRLLSGEPRAPQEVAPIYRGERVHASAESEMTTVCGERQGVYYVTPPKPIGETAREELARIENSPAWQLLQRIKRTWAFRKLADRRFGPGWDRVDPSVSAWQRLAQIRASRTYRIIRRLESNPLYRWQTQRRQRTTTPRPDDGRLELVSVDVWDTLLRRWCHPDEVKLATARYLYLKYFARLANPRCSPWSLMRERVQCEADLAFREKARGNDDEYRIGEVLEEWLRRVFAERPDDQQAGQLSRELVDHELKQELAVTYPDEAVGSVLAAWPCERRIFVSDFYMGADNLARIVQHHCPGAGLERGFASCDVSLNKRSGRLFEVIDSQLGVRPERHLHIGDNEHVDVASPRARGIPAIHYQNQREEAKRSRRQAWFAERPNSVDMLVKALQAELQRVVTAPPGLSGEAAGSFELGRRFSPLHFAFVLFAIEEAIKTGVSTMYYFTREGEFLRQVHDTIADADPLGLTIPRAETLDISRLASFFPSLRAIATKELMRAWNLYSSQSMAALFRTLGLEPREYAAHVERHSLVMDEPVTYPWNDPRVIALFDDPGLLAQLGTALDTRRGTFLRYLQSKGIHAGLERLFIVDIGWRGTIQDNLAYLLPNTRVSGVYLGLFQFLNAQPANVSKQAFGPNENTEGLGPTEVIRYVAPLEMVANSPSGSVLGYRETASGLEVVREVDADENAVFDRYTRHFQAGVLAAVPVLCEWTRRHALSAADLRPTALRLLAELTQSPPALLARAYCSLSHNETFGVGAYVSKRIRFPLALAARGMFSKSSAREFIRFIEDTGWPQGFLNRYRLYPLTRLYNRYRRAWIHRANLAASSQCGAAERVPP